jgi:hypothetical protein
MSVVTRGTRLNIIVTAVETQILYGYINSKYNIATVRVLAVSVYDESGFNIRITATFLVARPSACMA